MACGYAAASMDRIAVATSVSKPTLYSYFQGKEGLFTALIQQVSQTDRLLDESRFLQLPIRDSLKQLAMGFLAVANEAMCRPIRALTEAKGYDITAHVLACFGSAGGQHACAIARSLGMRRDR